MSSSPTPSLTNVSQSSCFSINLKWGKTDVHLFAPHNATISSVKEQLRILTQVLSPLPPSLQYPPPRDHRSGPSASSLRGRSCVMAQRAAALQTTRRCTL
jgi:hypothetical protein